MKKKKIIIISICLAIVLLIGSVMLISYNKFGTINVFSAANGVIRVMYTNAQSVRIQEDPQIIIAEPNTELLDRYMDSLGYTRVEDKQLGALCVFSNGSEEQHIMYSQNEHYSLWEWQEQ